MFDTPILFLIYNRPEITYKSFDIIRQMKPSKLFISADGPKNEIVGDFEKCKATRDFLNIDWDCEIYRRYLTCNLGCGLAPFSAITWFFNNVEEGIILEDDCLPHIDFFHYCKSMLDYYRFQENIYYIGGSSFICHEISQEKSYYFSAGHQGTWGWATWKRSWIFCNYKLTQISKKDIKLALNEYFPLRAQKKYWLSIFDRVNENQMNNTCWDYQFYFSGWLRKSLAIIPTKNLVRNIGYGVDATHTTSKGNPLMDYPEMSIMPLIMNDNIMQDKRADILFFKRFLCKKTHIIKRIKIGILNLTKSLKKRVANFQYR